MHLSSYYSPYSRHRYSNHYSYGYGLSFGYGLAYGYGYGYSPRYYGSYSSAYGYYPATTYNYYDYSYYPTSARNSSYYYPASARAVTTYTNTVYTTAARAPTYVVAEDYNDQIYGAGWSYLANGQDRTAFRYFSKEASRHIDDGQSKLGYSIASAFLGKHDRAIWAMRRALTVDPYSLSTIRFDTKLLERIDQLAEHYAQQADNTSDPDADFMLAALSFLLTDHELASIAIDKAIGYGDDSDATINLKAMIAEFAPTDKDYP